MPSDQLPPEEQQAGNASKDSSEATTQCNKVVQLPCPDAASCAARANAAHQDSPEAPLDNVVNLFTGETIDPNHCSRIVRVCPEPNGARMLYATLDQPERMVAVPILCWALLEDGSVTGMVPWLDEVLPCFEIEQKYSISWEGYYCGIGEDFFYEPPAEVVAQLGIAARFNGSLLNNARADGTAAVADLDNWQIVQEIPDPIGTHALLLNDDSDAMVLTSVISWTLDDHGRLHGMLADDTTIEKLPVLPGDGCLYCAEEDPHFKCYFQRDIAEQIRLQNPETMQAIEQLFGN